MDGLMIYLLCVAAFFLLCPLIITVAYIFSDYRPNEAQKRPYGRNMRGRKKRGNARN